MPVQPPNGFKFDASEVIDKFAAAGAALAAALAPPPFDHLTQAIHELASAADSLESSPPMPGTALVYLREAQHHLRQHAHRQALKVEQPMPHPGPLIEAAAGQSPDLAAVLAAAHSFGPSQVEHLRQSRPQALPYAQGWADCLAYLAERAQAAKAAREAVGTTTLERRVPDPPFSGLAETFAMIDRARSATGRDEVFLRDGRKVSVTLSSRGGVRLVSWQLGEAESTQGDCVAALDADFAGMRMTDGGLA